MRARAHQSRAIWDVINPTASGTFTTVNASAAAADAQAVITAAGGNSADVEYDLVYSSGSQRTAWGDGSTTVRKTSIPPNWSR
ncbi:MAG: hypothetical protein CM1200mP14_25890 [Gammaproteobacteria bacterium]|nr:MAG: hypothetical protein CM1200mP14_25890 [Gammaproteobacteria bacterium]